jgi:16S rRNA G966 N2-methylase RsmD
MSLKVKEKIFPKVDDMDKLQYDEEGLYSISRPEDANEISEIIKDYIGHDDLRILDATAGLGGNTISFSKYFKYVKSIELEKNRYDMLVDNVSLYKLTNVELINDNCIDHLKDDSFDIYFFDPPWGGPDYKSQQNLDLTLGGMGLHNILKLISKDKIVVFKVPFNYNLNLLKDYDFVIKKIRNILIILLKIV